MTVEQVAQFLDRLPSITTGVVGAVIAVGISFFFIFPSGGGGTGWIIHIINIGNGFISRDKGSRMNPKFSKVVAPSK